MHPILLPAAQAGRFDVRDSMNAESGAIYARSVRPSVPPAPLLKALLKNRQRLEEVFGWQKTVGGLRKTKLTGRGAQAVECNLPDRRCLCVLPLQPDAHRLAVGLVGCQACRASSGHPVRDFVKRREREAPEAACRGEHSKGPPPANGQHPFHRQRVVRFHDALFGDLRGVSIRPIIPTSKKQLRFCSAAVLSAPVLGDWVGVSVSRAVYGK